MILEKRIPLSYWLKIIKIDLIFVSLFAIVAHYVTDHFLKLNVPLSIPAFLGTSIALLLSFKLSQSYDRWWEARKIWGEIVNDSRTLVVQLKSFSLGKMQEVVQQMAYRQIAWCYTLTESLRYQRLPNSLDAYLPSEELLSLSSQKNPSLKLMAYQAKDLSELHQLQVINSFQQIQIDNTLIRLVAAMGKAERINNTVFPRTYRKVLHLIILTFLTFLSIALTDFNLLTETVIITAIAIPFFLLEKIAFLIQAPFENEPTDTAMTSISRTIEINIRQLLEEPEIPEGIQSESFYIL